MKVAVIVDTLGTLHKTSEKTQTELEIGGRRKIIIFTNPSARAGYDTRSIFKRSLTGLNSEFSFFWTSCLTKAEEPSLSYYLPIAGGRIIGFIFFPRVLVLYDMQSVSSRISTRVAVSISYDDNHYTEERLYRPQHCWNRRECWEKFRRPKETQVKSQ